MSQQVVETDVLIVGGGPSGLSAAIHLADLSQEKNLPAKILVLEKGSDFGNHTLSGAIINPVAFNELLPDLHIQDLPFECQVTDDETWFLTKESSFKAPFHPPYMNNQGYSIASLGKVVKWLSGIAEGKGVQVYPGFSAHELLYDNGKVVGVKTGDSGIDKNGNPQPNYQPGTEVRAKITILAEGPRGHLAKGLIEKFDLAKGKNPQIYSVGVKELWRVKEGAFEAGRVVHAMGYPLGMDQFGGAWIYGLPNNQVSMGLAIGLDYKDPTFDPHNAFQVFKRHPFVKKILEGGAMLKYGAKTIPEGGFFALPKLHHDGAMIIGDSAGFLSMPSLKGVHLGMQSGMMAARSALEALEAKDFSDEKLSRYQELFNQSDAKKDLYQVRNFRQGFKKHLTCGAINFGALLVTKGRGLSLSGRLKMEEDCKESKKLSEVAKNNFKKKYKDNIVFDKKLTFDKVTDIFFSGTQHDEHQPSHLLVPDLELCRNVCIPTYGGPCQHFCPAEVYEIVEDPKTGKKDLHLHPTNCVHCKTCDIKDPFKNINWITPYGGDGPEYENL